jgi:anti-sigma regulatory factor (Ser/Thr protein kinase)
LVVDDETLERLAVVGRDHPTTVLLDADPELAGVLASFGGRYRALHAVPIGDRDDSGLGTISLLSLATGLAATDWSLLESFADQAAAALKRARVFEHEHELATRLQRNLLPDRLPTSEGVGLSGHYHAGGAAVEVGGDWYDAVRRPDGIVQLCVGDVSGKGIGAATVMGRHRNTFHAYAYECTSPGEIIRKMLRHVDGDLMITVACVSVDPYTAEVSYSCAGHPPPLLVDRATHEVRRLDGASAPPLGVAEPGEIVERSIQLDGPSTLALYTDGLIERRGRNIDQAIDFLGGLIAADGAITPAGVLEQITDAIGHPVDDVALLVAAIDDPASFDVEFSASPAVLPGLRRRLRLWLKRRDLAGDVLAEVVLAVSEACNNAIEHAYRGQDGTLRVRVVAADGLLHATIGDDGEWRDATPGGDRGRGILLMRSLMDSAEIETSASGTQVRLERRYVAEAPPHLVSALA